MYVNIGKSVNIIAQVKNDPQPILTWSTDDVTIAKVDNGNVTGLDYGKTVVTATYIDSKNEKHTASANVIVGDGDPNITLTDVSFKDGDLFMPLNDTYQIALVLTPSRGYVESEKFTSSNTRVVTVDSHGLVKSVGEGEAVVTCDVNNGQFKKELRVYVSRDYTRKEIIITPEKITFDGELRKIKVGTIERLSYSLEPSNADPDKLIWTSSDEKVVTVENGKIKGIAEGRAIVTVSSVNGAKDRIDVEVESDIVEVTDINVAITDVNLTVGQSQIIVPIISPDNASNKALSYTSLDSTVAYVVPNETGTQATITGLAAGYTTIVIRSSNGIEKKVYVTVTGSNNSGNSGNQGGSSDGGGNSSTIVVRVNGEVPAKTCTGQELKYYDKPTVKITLNGGIGSIKYCYSTSGNCTPTLSSTSTTSFTITGKGVYTLRIKKFDKSGNEIESSDGGNYNNGALEYYINTKAAGEKCSSSGGSTSSTCASITTQTECLARSSNGCAWNSTTRKCYLKTTHSCGTNQTWSAVQNKCVCITGYVMNSLGTCSPSGTTKPGTTPVATPKVTATPAPTPAPTTVIGTPATITITDKGINDGQKKTNFNLEGPAGTTYAFNVSANKDGKFTSKIISGTDCIAFTQSGFAGPITSVAGQKYGIAVKRVDNTKTCSGTVRITYTTTGNAVSTKDIKINVAAVDAAGPKWTCKAIGSVSTVCSYSRYTSKAYMEYSLNTGSTTGTTAYGCVSVYASQCGVGAGSCYQKYQCTKS